jgi:hypothetical protein
MIHRKGAEGDEGKTHKALIVSFGPRVPFAVKA